MHGIGIAAVVLRIAAASSLQQPAEPPVFRGGPFEVSLLLPSAGLFAGEEMEVEFRVTKSSETDPSAAQPLKWGAIRADLDMPSMPAMPRFSELAHREDVAGVFGVHPTFSHGGDYRLCLTVLPPEIQAIGDPRPTVPYTFEFPLTVYDATASPRPVPARVRPYVLDVTATPRHPIAGQDVDLELSVRLAGSLDLREVVDFDLVHERLMHLFLVRSDRTLFAHEHPIPAGPGTFRLRYRFAAPGSYRIFADVAPRDAGSQILSAILEVGGATPAPAPPAAPPNAEAVEAVLEMPSGRLRSGRTETVIARLRDRNGRPVGDLRPWLGAMAHLLLLHEDAATFAHAHPDEREPGVGREGRVPFLVRLPRPGEYRGWLQFQRAGSDRVETVEVSLHAAP